MAPIWEEFALANFRSLLTVAVFVGVTAILGLGIVLRAAPSANGTRVPRDAAQITDSGNHVWTMIANPQCPSGYQEIRRDGARPVPAYATCGSTILFFNGAIFAIGDDNMWYAWYEAQVTWVFLGATAPDGDSQPPQQPPPPGAPTISCPANRTATAPSSAGIAVTYPAPTVSGGTPPTTVVTQPVSGSIFPVGNTTVTATVTDAAGRKASCSFVVTVTTSTQPPPPSDDGDSSALGLWTPTSRDTCTKAQHDAYGVPGPDGKRYPTWHPPTGPNGCTFGHEHGRNPSGSALLNDVTAQYGGVLFGYANEQLDVWNSTQGVSNGMRHEDHVGHKVEWENNVTIYESTTTGGSNRRALSVTCDFFMKIHQGTHSPDAFTNNMHELLYAMQCRDGSGGGIGTKVIVTKMVVFGVPGTFSEGSVAGGFTTISAGSPMPANSPTGPGLRSLPTINRVLQSVLVPSGQYSDLSQGLYEDWISANYIQQPGQSQALLYFDPHFAVFKPSRFYWPGSDPNTYGITRTAADRAANIGRSVDVCWMRQGGEQARVGECDGMTNYGAIGLPFGNDDPRSAFNGIHREFYFNNTTVVNPGNQTLWYTDPFGNGAGAGTSPGTIQQYISTVDNRKRTESGFISGSGRSYPLESVAVGKDRSYGGSGVHAPN
jgi:HYR domain